MPIWNKFTTWGLHVRVHGAPEFWEKDFRCMFYPNIPIKSHCFESTSEWAVKRGHRLTLLMSMWFVYSLEKLQSVSMPSLNRAWRQVSCRVCMLESYFKAFGRSVAASLLAEFNFLPNQAILTLSLQNKYLTKELFIFLATNSAKRISLLISKLLFLALLLLWCYPNAVSTFELTTANPIRFSIRSYYCRHLLLLHLSEMGNWESAPKNGAALALHFRFNSYCVFPQRRRASY